MIHCVSLLDEAGTGNAESTCTRHISLTALVICIMLLDVLGRRMLLLIDVGMAVDPVNIAS
jgi:hypothetical protein